jgi:subtilisin-like proprotein convertase family protein
MMFIVNKLLNKLIMKNFYLNSPPLWRSRVLRNAALFLVTLLGFWDQSFAQYPQTKKFTFCTTTPTGVNIPTADCANPAQIGSITIPAQSFANNLSTTGYRLTEAKLVVTATTWSNLNVYLRTPSQSGSPQFRTAQLISHGSPDFPNFNNSSPNFFGASPMTNCSNVTSFATFDISAANTAAPMSPPYASTYRPVDDFISTFATPGTVNPNGTWTILGCSDYTSGFAYGTFVGVRYIQLTFSERPNCTNPANFTLDYVLHNIAGISWTSANNSVAQIKYGTPGFDPETAGTLFTPKPNTRPGKMEVQLTNLSPTTSYEVYVREECGTNWIGPVAFTTECTPVDVRFDADSLQTFESSTINLPTCWKRYSLAPTNEPWQFARTAQYGRLPNFDKTTGSGFFASQHDNDFIAATAPNPNITLETRLYDVSGLKKLRMAFWLNMSEGFTWASGYNLPVLRVDFFDGKRWNLDVYSNSTRIINPWEEIELNLNNYTISGPVKLRWVVDTRYRTGANIVYYMSTGVDDVSVREAPLCPNPTNISANNILDTSADIFWTSANADSLSPKNTFRVMVGTQDGVYNVATVTGTLTKGNNGLQKVTITGLQPNTNYFYAVMDLCGSYLMKGPGPFRTLCAKVPAPLLDKGGDLNNFGSVPTCFLNFNPVRSNQAIVWQFPTTIGFVNFGGPRFDATGNRNFATPTPPTGANDQTLQTRLVDISALNKPIMSFKVSSHFASATFRVDLFDGQKWIEDVYSYRGGINTADGTGNGLTRWVDQEVNLIRHNLDKTKPLMARFVANSASVQFYYRVGVDDINFKEAGPCNRPFALGNIGVSIDQGIVTWQHTRPVSFLGYDIRFRKEGATQWADTVFYKENLAVIFGLDQGTKYEWQVRANCDGRGFSDWSTSDFFTTYRTGSVCDFPNTIKTLPYERLNLTTNLYGNNYNPLDACESPFMAGQDQVFAYTPTRDIVVRVTLSNTINKAGVFITEGCPDLSFSSCVASDTSANPVIRQVLLRKDKEYFIIVDNKPSPDTTRFNIKVEEIRCPEPIDVKLENVTNTTAQIKWTAISSSRNKWNVAVVRCGQPRGSGVDVNTTDYSVSGLDPNTCYDLYLREDCGNGDLSTIVGPITFYTLRNPFNNPTTCVNVSVQDNNCDNRNLIPISVTGQAGNMGEATILKAIKVIVQHANLKELSMSLISPSGKEVALVDQTKVSGINYGGNPINCPTVTATFDGSSNTAIPAAAPYTGTYTPVGNFNDFNDGNTPNGLWKLKLCDNVSGNAPTFRYAELIFRDAPKLNVQDVSVAENVNTGIGRFRLSLSAAVDFRVSVDYETKGISARSGVDFFPARGTVVFQPGETVKFVDISILDDFLNERDETLELLLSNPVNTSLVRTSAIMTIVDNDPKPSMTINDVFISEADPVASFSMNLSELSGRDIEFEVYTRNRTTGLPVGVRTATGGVPGGNGDYISVSTPRKVIIPEGTQGRFDVLIQDDFRDEFDEQFELIVTKLDGATLRSNDSIGVCTIFDDDNPPFIVVSSAQANESDPNGIVFRATLTQDSDKDVSVRWSTRDQTATSVGSNSDYVGVTNQILSFTQGQRVATFSVKTIDDLIVEPWETFTIQLSQPTDVVIPAGSPATGTIINDDFAPLALNDYYEANEDEILSVSAQNGVLTNDLDGSASTGKKVAFVVAQPLNGFVVMDSSGAFTYLSAPNFHGNDFFTYRVFDGINTSIEAVVTIKVKPVSDAPFFIKPVPDVTLCSGSSISFDFNEFVEDIDDDVRDFEFLFNYRVVDASGDLLVEDLVVTNNRNTHVMTFTPVTPLSGDYVVEIKATDKAGASTTDVFKITVKAAAQVKALIPNAACENTEFNINISATVDGSGSPIQQLEVDYLLTNGLPGTDGVSDVVFDNPNATITYPRSAPGKYDIAYRVKSTSGCDEDKVIVQQIQVYEYPQSRIFQVGGQLVATLGKSYRWYFNGQPLPDSLGGNRQALNAVRIGDYRVEVTNEGGCTTFSPLLILTPSGLEDVSSTFDIYPNPTSGLLKLNLKNEMSGAITVEIMDNAGSLVRMYNLGEVKGQFEHVLDVSKLSSGMYHLRVTDSKSVANKKFIKE